MTAGSRRWGRKAGRARQSDRREHRQASAPEPEVEHERGGTEPRAKQSTYYQHGERLQCHRDRGERQRHCHLRSQRHGRRPSTMAEPATVARLPDADPLTAHR